MHRKFIIHLLTALVIFAQGLYFNEQWLTALICVVILLAFRIIQTKEIRWQWSTITIFLSVQLVLDLLGYYWFLEKGMLIFGLMQRCLYLLFCLLLMQFDSSLTEDVKEGFLHMMAAAGLVTTFAFMTDRLGQLQYVIDNRAAGPVQYANTFGILLVAALLLQLNASMKIHRRILLNLCLMVPLILTMSRANYLVALVMLVVALLIHPAKKAIFMPLVSSVPVGIGVLYFFDNSDTALRLMETADASEWHSRLLYYSDSLKMVMDRPMGFGTNGYHYVQSFYQTGSTYHVKFVHSGLIQSFLDQGIAGGLVMAAFMVSCVFLGKHSIDKRLVLTAILGHSLIDMNLQFPVVWLLMITMLAWEGDLRTFSIRPVTAAAMGLLVLLMSLMVLRPAMAYGRGDYRGAISAYPYYTEAYRQLLGKVGEDPAMADYGKKLWTMNPYVTEAYGPLAAEAKENHRYDEALYWYDQRVQYSPLLIEHHEAYSHGLILAATYWHAYGMDGKALEAIEQMLLFPAILGELAKERYTDYNVKHIPELRMTSALLKDYEEASYLKGTIEGTR